MKFIENVKNYWEENKDEIIRKVKTTAICVGVGTIAFVAGEVSAAMELASNIKNDTIARGDYDGLATSCAMNRNNTPEFDNTLNEAANTGYITDSYGDVRKVIGAIIYTGELKEED